MRMRLGSVLGRALGQVHTHALCRQRRAFSLTEVLVGVALTAILLGVVVTSLVGWSTDTRTLPVLGARTASDAQVQQMIGELRSAVSVGYISPIEVVATISTNSTAGTTPTVNGAATGLYQVAYYFGTSRGLLYRNPGPAVSGTVSAPTVTLPRGQLPSPPTAPAVNPPGPQPTAPTCPSPCYDPTGAYVTSYSVSVGGCVSDWMTACRSWSGTVPASNPEARTFWGLASIKQYWGANGTSCRTPSPTGTGAPWLYTATYNGLGAWVCDEVQNNVVMMGGYIALAFIQYIPPTCRGGKESGECWGNYYLAEIAYTRGTKSANYYLPSCGCTLSQSQYTADVTNWNNYQTAKATYTQQMAAWQGAKNQWGAYATAYGQYTSQVTSANISLAWAITATGVTQAAPTLSSGSWPSTSPWRLVADDIQSLTFTGYDATFTPTTGASKVHTLGITVQYNGLPAEQELITLMGTQASITARVHPLIIPPAPPDPRTCSACGRGAWWYYTSWQRPTGPIFGRGGAADGRGHDVGFWGGAYTSLGTPVTVGTPGGYAYSYYDPATGTWGYGSSYADAVTAARAANLAAAHKEIAQVSGTPSPSPNAPSGGPSSPSTGPSAGSGTCGGFAC